MTLCRFDDRGDNPARLQLELRLFGCHIAEEFPRIAHVLPDARGNVEDRGQRVVGIVNCIDDAALVRLAPLTPASGLLSGHSFEHLLRGDGQS